jgi:hypothetical protein
LVANITGAIQDLTQLLMLMNATTANPCCKLPLLQDSTLLMNMTVVLRDELFVYSYDVETQILGGIANAISVLFGNWTDW